VLEESKSKIGELPFLLAYDNASTIKGSKDEGSVSKKGMEEEKLPHKQKTAQIIQVWYSFVAIAEGDDSRRKKE